MIESAMKTKLIATMVALVLIMSVEARGINWYENAGDYARFERWLAHVQKLAPRYGLKLHSGAEDEQEFFYLYCWQSDDQKRNRGTKTQPRIKQ